MLVQISTKITIIKALLNILPSSAGAGASVGLLVSGIGICFIPPRTRTCLSVVAYARKDKTMKYVDIPAFGQLIEYIIQAEPALVNGEMVADVIINQVDLSDQPIIEAAETIKADY